MEVGINKDATYSSQGLAQSQKLSKMGFDVASFVTPRFLQASSKINLNELRLSLMDLAYFLPDIGHVLKLLNTQQ